MRVGVRGSRKVSVSQSFLNHLEIHTGRQEQTGLSMTKVVEHKRLWDAGRLSNWIPHLSVEIGTSQMPALQVRKHNRHLIRIKAFLMGFLQTAFECIHHHGIA